MIYFTSDILTNRVKNKVEQRCRYKIVQWNNKVSFYILADISDHVTLVQLEYSSDNVNHAVSITGSWICDSNYKISLLLVR